MSAYTLLISDLHLESSRPEITRALLGFLKTHRGLCARLFILGDLFEAWIGDDDPSPLGDEVAAGLSAFAAAGAEVFLMHGNRDFLLGQDYAARCHATLIAEPHIIDTPAGDAILVHGDQLCLDDTEYLKFRDMVRDPAWQAEFLARPLAERRAFADQARAESREATSSKSMDIMDVNPQAVDALLTQWDKRLLIHGHTHRPAVHDLTGTGATRMVLGDWGPKLWYIRIDDDGAQLIDAPLAT